MLESRKMPVILEMEEPMGMHAGWEREGYIV